MAKAYQRIRVIKLGRAGWILYGKDPKGNWWEAKFDVWQDAWTWLWSHPEVR